MALMKINTNIFVASLLALLVSLAPNVCSALANIGTWSFLNGTPAEVFNKQDWSLFEATIMDTLNTAQDDETKTWANPKTRASGEVKVLRTVKTSAQDCRLLRLTNKSPNRENAIELIFCKQPNGSWKIASPSPASKPKK